MHLFSCVTLTLHYSTSDLDPSDLGTVKLESANQKCLNQHDLPKENPCYTSANQSSETEANSTNENEELKNSNHNSLNVSPTQNCLTTDGCFASFFNALLNKMRAEIEQKASIDPLVTREDFDIPMVHSHLLAGLLGQHPGETEALLQSFSEHGYTNPGNVSVESNSSYKSGSNSLKHDSVEHFLTELDAVVGYKRTESETDTVCDKEIADDEKEGNSDYPNEVESTSVTDLIEEGYSLFTDSYIEVGENVDTNKKIITLSPDFVPETPEMNMSKQSKRGGMFKVQKRILMTPQRKSKVDEDVFTHSRKPLKSIGVDNNQEHLPSPYLNKLPTDQVTRRRKRKCSDKDRDSTEWSRKLSIYSNVSLTVDDDCGEIKVEAESCGV